MPASRKKAASPRRRRAYPRRIVIAPSLLAADFSDLKNELRRCQRARCTWIHLDVMDGHFVPNITIGPPVIRSLRKVSKSLFLDAHLMIDKPLKMAPAFVEAGAQLITIHQETVGSVRRAVRALHKMGVQAGVSIKPRTPVSTLEPFLDEIDLALVMTVEPGFGGQEMIPAMLNKVRQLALWREEKKYTFQIQVDGGINAATAPLATAAGANVLVAGTYMFNGSKMEQNAERLLANVDPSLNGHGLLPR
jgi:ribulose-phosphate 3-epimerase